MQVNKFYPDLAREELITRGIKKNIPPPTPNPSLIIGNANPCGMIAAIGATIAGKERIFGPVIRSAIGVENPDSRLTVELLIAEETKLDGSRSFDVRFVNAQDGYMIFLNV